MMKSNSHAKNEGKQRQIAGKPARIALPGRAADWLMVLFANKTNADGGSSKRCPPP
jgi:hypothetical protein